jgi:hypothetical protein
MTASSPQAPRTVGDLIAELEKFGRHLDVVTANALTGTSDSFELILTVGLLPPDDERLAILYMPKDQAGGST